ncbi:hypothetical protein M758_10G166100, partial [Ceratodon purpureus]
VYNISSANGGLHLHRGHRARVECTILKTRSFLIPHEQCTQYFTSAKRHLQKNFSNVPHIRVQLSGSSLHFNNLPVLSQQCPLELAPTGHSHTMLTNLTITALKEDNTPGYILVFPNPHSISYILQALSSNYHHYLKPK